MKANIITVKKEIPHLLKKGDYIKEDVIEAYPYLNFGDSTYFEFRERETKLNPGDRVIYKGQKYFIVSIVNPVKPNISESNMGAKVIRRVYKDNRYNIGKGPNVPPHDQITVEESELSIPDIYWFINSSGELASAFKGEKPNADEWRNQTNNCFKSKEDAKAALNEFLDDTLQVYDYNGRSIKKSMHYLSLSKSSTGNLTLYHVGENNECLFPGSGIISYPFPSMNQELINDLKLFPFTKRHIWR